MRKAIIAVVLICIIFAMKMFIDNMRDFKEDVVAAKKITITYSGKTKTAAECLKNLTGKDGTIKWVNSEIINSAKNNAANVEALVTGVDSKGKSHTASFIFYTNHDTSEFFLEQVFLDGKLIESTEAYKLLVTGSFG